MAKARGKCPSLITGNHGKPKFETALRKRKCKRCNEAIIAGSDCVAIPIAGQMGSRTYCKKCFRKIIDQTQKDLNGLKEILNN